MPVMKRRREAESAEVDTEGSWAISYGDMITLLLTFFILFFSTDPQKDRMAAIEKSLLMRLSEGSRANAAETAGGDGASRAPSSEASGGAPGDAKVQAASTPGVDQLPLSHAKVHKIEDRLMIEFPEISFFDLGKVELTKQGQLELQNFVSKYLPFAGTYQLSIRAFTDTKKVMKLPNRRFTDNLELSALRAIAAMRTLQAAGIPLNRMRIGGYGELHQTAQDLAQVRRDPAAEPRPSIERDLFALSRKVVLVVEPDAKDLP